MDVDGCHTRVYDQFKNNVNIYQTVVFLGFVKRSLLNISDIKPTSFYNLPIVHIQLRCISPLNNLKTSRQ